MNASGSAPIGSIPWQGALVIIVALIATACWGYLLGVILPRMMTPLLAAGLIYLVFQIPLTFPEWRWTRLVIPYDIAHEMAPYINDAVYPRLLGVATLWFASLAALPVAILFLRMRRSLSWLALFTVLLIITAISGWQVNATAIQAPQWHANNRDQNCIVVESIEFCAPLTTLSRGDLQENATLLLALFPNWFPTSVLPERFSLPIDGGHLPAGDAPMRNTISSPRREISEVGALMTILSNQVASHDMVPTAAQATIACVLLRANGKVCNPAIPNPQVRDLPDAGNTQESITIYNDIVGEQPGPGSQLTTKEQQQIGIAKDGLQTKMSAKADAFAALPDDEKTTWIEAHWERLHSGELTLDELPG
ncbi:MAG: hypothetical protein ACR2OE_19085 [Thermomicrobiales bacterium]